MTECPKRLFFSQGLTAGTHNVTPEQLHRTDQNSIHRSMVYNLLLKFKFLSRIVINCEHFFFFAIDTNHGTKSITKSAEVELEVTFPVVSNTTIVVPT